MNESDDFFNETYANYSDSCHYEQPPLTNVRFWMVTICGTIISVISILENLLLFFVFARRKEHRNNHNMYLMLLAFFDVFVSVAYVCLMSVNVLSDYLIEPALLGLWFSYMVPMITISHIAITSATFCIVAASFERYCLTTNSFLLPWVQKNRRRIAVGFIILAVISKGTIFIEYDVSVDEECVGTMMEWVLTYKQWVFDTPYHVFWRLWYRNVMTIMVPFFSLMYLNARIVRTLSTTSTNGGIFMQLAGNIAVEQARRKANARAATRTLVMVVCCYLASNIVNVVITFWEHVDKKSLFHYVNFYSIALELVSLMTELACACRLPIYLSCQVALRQEIASVLRNAIYSICRLRQHSRKPHVLLEPPSPVPKKVVSRSEITVIPGEEIEQPKTTDIRQNGGALHRQYTVTSREINLIFTSGTETLL